MATGQFFKLDMDAWDDGTAGLTLEQQGAYLRILNQIYRRGASVLSDAISLGGYLRCHPNKARALVGQLIDAGKLAYDHTGRLMNGRASREIEERRQLSETRAQAGRQGGRPANLSTASPPAPPPSPPQLPPPHHAEVAAPILPQKPQNSGQSGNQVLSDKIRGDKRRVDTDSTSKTLSMTQSRAPSVAQPEFALGEGPAAKPKQAVTSAQFEAFKAAYPRTMRPEWAKARDKFEAAVKSGVNPQTIIDASAGYARACLRDSVDPQYVKRPYTWLNQKSWRESYEPEPPRLVAGKVVDTYLYDPRGFMRTA